MESRDRTLDMAQVLVEEMQALDVLQTDFSLRSIDRNAALSEVQTEILKRGSVSALCLSGGGFRSSTFCLGVLQQLSNFGLLSKFDYLSTVSGGGLAGGWLKAWTLRDDGKGDPLGITGVEAVMAKANVEPTPIRFLRYYSNYLVPRFNPFSADTWTIAATYLRDLLLNWMVLIPLFMLPLLGPMLYMAVQRAVLSENVSHRWLFGLGVVSLLYGGANLRRGLPSAGREELTQGVFLRQCLLPLVLGVACFTAWFARVMFDPSLVGSLSFWSYWPWYGEIFGVVSLFDFSSLLSITVIFNLAAFSIGRVPTLLGSPGYSRGPTNYSPWWPDLWAMLLTAFVAAALIWNWVQLFSTVDPRSATYVIFAMPALLAVFTLSEVFYIGAASYFTDDLDREFWARVGAWDLIVIAIWIAISALALHGPVAIESFAPTERIVILASAVAAGGIAVAIGPGVLASAVGQSGKRSIGMRVLLVCVLLIFSVVLMTFLAYLATILFSKLAALIVENALLSWITRALQVVRDEAELTSVISAGDVDAVLASVSIGIVLLVAMLLCLLQYVMARIINVNKFSLHATLGNRVVRAYLGASLGRERNPNPFTGVDQRDNPHLGPFAASGVRRPLHVINMALNLVRGKNLGWQERTASSFTATAFHCGGYDVGYCRTEEYADRKGLSLGTALIISGAATRYSDYRHLPLLTFVMSFFNLKFGWWLGNPRRESALASGPTHAAAPLIAETFGLAGADDRWICLSDGGQFDNLGLYEMVARRVRKIVVVDASPDPEYKFQALFDAIGRILVELRIRVEADGPMKIGRRLKGGAYCATFRIRYSTLHAIADVPQQNIDGELLYIKPALSDFVPLEVAQYAAAANDFPQEAHIDDFYTSSQFEGYRALGEYEMRNIVKGRNVQEVGDLIECGRIHARDATYENAFASDVQVFISYRRTEAEVHAGRLRERLAARWGDQRVFMDVRSITPGQDFLEAIDQTLARSRAMIVLIGPHWLEAKNAEGRGLDDEKDHHRIEIERGLTSGRLVIPVTIDGASMPNKAALPDSLRALTNLNALPLVEPYFEEGVLRVIKAIERGAIDK